MRRTLQLLAFVVAAVGCQWATAADDWQTRSRVWQRDLVREARAVWGIDAPVPVMAGQIHQESLWRAHARSKYASGLAQFTPDTEAWIKAAYPQALAVGNAFDPRWAIRALVTYDHHLYQRIRAANDCERWAMTLSAYNGGLGWLQRDQRLAAQRGADPLRWWGNVERYSRRAKWAIAENRGYPRAIIYQHQALYRDWGGGVVCAR